VKTLSALAAAALLLSTSVIARAEDEQCHIYHVAKFDMGVDESGGVYVPMTISGHSVNLLIDTGGVLSMLTDKTVTDMGLSRSAIFDGGFQMYGGARVDHYATVHDIDLGGLKASRMTMLILPDGLVAPSVGGTLAPDILGAYDDDFDFGNGKFTLFLKDHCPGKVVYWTASGYAEIPMRVDDQGHITLPVEIDGQEVRATLDTGASRSVMSLETAKSLLNLKDGDPALKASPEFGGAAFTHEFHTLTFHNVRVDNPDITLVPDDTSKMYGEPPLILGMGILRQLHMYISYKEHKIYVTAASAH
jgi:predicted aspartyl protease